MSWRHVNFGDQHTADKFRRLIPSICVVDRNGDLHPAGSAFIVSVIEGGDAAIAFCAGHVFTGIRDFLRPIPSGFVVPEFIEGRTFDLQEEMNNRQLVAICMIGNQLAVCDLRVVRMASPTDLALLVLNKPAGLTERFANTVQINSDPPAVGTEIVVAAFSEQRVQRVDALTQDYHSTLAMRLGSVTAMHLSGSALVRSPVFRINVPTDRGMSGGPVFFHDPTRSALITACGVISADESPDSAFADCEVDGDSIASLLWPGGGLALLDNHHGHLTLKDMVERGVIPDAGGAIRKSTLVRMGGEQWRISYPISPP